MLMVLSVPGIPALDAAPGMSDRLGAEGAPENHDAWTWLAWPKNEPQSKRQAICSSHMSSLGCQPLQLLICEDFPCLVFISLSAQPLSLSFLFFFFFEYKWTKFSKPICIAIRHWFFLKLGIISEVSLCTLSCSCISVIQVSSLNNHTVAVMLFTWKELCFIDGKCCNALSCQDENLKKKLFIVYATWNLYTEPGCRENIFKYTYAMTTYSKLHSPGMREWAQEHIPTAKFLAWAQSSSTLPSHFQAETTC